MEGREASVLLLKTMELRPTIKVPCVPIALLLVATFNHSS